jgi:hypothetical protein
LLEAVDRDLWVHHHPFKLAGLFRLGHRMTVIRLADGGLVLHSPTPLDEALSAELAALGPVRYVLAPSLMHNLFLEPYGERYPDATFLSVPGFQEKNPAVRHDGVLDGGSAGLPAEELRALLLRGMPRVNETAVLHVPTRTLIVADLVFNFGEDVPVLTALLLSLVGARRGVRVSRLVRSLVRDRDALRGSLEELLQLPFERLIVGHGNIVETDAATRIRRAYDWVLDPS